MINEILIFCERQQMYTSSMGNQGSVMLLTQIWWGNLKPDFPTKAEMDF